MGDVSTILASLQHEAEALSELELRRAQLSADRHRGPAQLDVLTGAIDARIDASIRIWEQLARESPRERCPTDVSALERQFRRLGALRAQVLALYVGCRRDQRDC